MTVLEQVDLRAANTLGLASVARYFAAPETAAEVAQLIRFARKADVPLKVLGEGSNVVLAPEINALVVRPANRGIRLLEQDNDTVLVEVEAAENWDALVAHCVEQGWYGLENLSLIPGSVGASPFQNIGAYGVELADRFESLDALSLNDGSEKTFSRQACAFGYRDSLFKSAERDSWLIWRIRLRLARQFEPVLGYADLAQRYEQLPAEQRDADGMRRLIIGLRQSKLPDPGQLPNAGSFFKNPVVPAAQAASLKALYPDLVSYPLGDDRCKLAAGWLIEQAGLKGVRHGALGMHAHQALVMVNYGQADAGQVSDFAATVRKAVEEKFAVELEQEPVSFGGQ